MYLPIFKPIFIQKLKWVNSEMVVDSRANVMIFFFFLQVIQSNKQKKITTLSRSEFSAPFRIDSLRAGLSKGSDMFQSLPSTCFGSFVMFSDDILNSHNMSTVNQFYICFLCFFYLIILCGTNQGVFFFSYVSFNQLKKKKLNFFPIIYELGSDNVGVTGLHRPITFNMSALNTTLGGQRPFFIVAL